MLSINFTSSLKKNIVLSLFALFMLCCTFLLMIGSTYHLPEPPAALLDTDNSAGSTTARINFVKKLGYSVEPSSEQKENIKIPMVFNDVYEGYNSIQQEIGVNLYNYRGAECVRFTYKISDSDYVVNLITYKNRVIGGDICTVALDGEMKPLGDKINE